VVSNGLKELFYIVKEIFKEIFCLIFT
jgi:hypothetical protein